MCCLAMALAPVESACRLIGSSKHHGWLLSLCPPRALALPKLHCLGLRWGNHRVLRSQSVDFRLTHRSGVVDLRRLASEKRLGQRLRIGKLVALLRLRCAKEVRCQRLRSVIGRGATHRGH